MSRIYKDAKRHSIASYPHLIIIFILSFTFLAYSFMSVTLNQRYMTFGLDLGYFDEALWKISQGIFPYSGVGCVWLMEDHFQPILYLVAQLYRLYDNVNVILIFQSLVMVLSALTLYLVAIKKTSRLFALTISISYLFFIGTQFAILNEFHQATLAPLFISLIFYALTFDRLFILVLSVLGLIITKEDYSLLVAAIGLGMIFIPKYRKIGLLIFLSGLFSFFFLINILLPAISIKGVYAHLNFGQAGYTPIDIVKHSLTNPVFFIQSMFWPSIKLKTLFQSFFNFGFLAIFSPLPYLLPLLEDFAVRFIYSGPQFTTWQLTNHHAAASGMLLSFSSVFGAVKIAELLKPKIKAAAIYKMFAFVLIGATLGSDLIFHGPVNSLLKKSFYGREDWMRNDDQIISLVPPQASVASQNNLLPHLTHRLNIYRLPFGLNSDYMVVDLHNQPNAYAPLNYSQMRQFVESLLSSKRYSIVKQKGEAILLKRNFKTDIRKSPYYGDTRYCYYSFEER